MEYDIEQPYGPLVTTTMRAITWNVWGKYGPWTERQARLEKVLAGHDADVVALQESWADEDGGGQAAELGERLKRHHAVGEGWLPCAVLSRWPIARTEMRALEGGKAPGAALLAEIDGPRGRITLFSVILAPFRPDESHLRQEQVRALGAFVTERADRKRPVIVCGDFNAPPDSDEIRMLTGRTATAAPRLVFYDAWEVAGSGGPGHTWSNDNRWAAPALPRPPLRLHPQRLAPRRRRRPPRPLPGHRRRRRPPIRPLRRPGGAALLTATGARRTSPSPNGRTRASGP